jgi:hypothetical protein
VLASIGGSIGCQAHILESWKAKVAEQREKNSRPERKKIKKRKVMILHFCWCLLQIVFYYLILVSVFNNMKPAFLQKEQCKAERSCEVPVKMVSFLHAIVTSCYGLAYSLGCIAMPELDRACLISTAFLLFDAVQSITFYQRDGDDSVLAHPYGVLFHHVVTVMFIHGILFNFSIAGRLAFFLSEIPVCFLNLTWLYFYLGQSESRECAIASIITIITYFIFRIVGFPLFFLFVLLPEMNFLNPLSYITLPLMVFIYLLNCLWFFKLLHKTMKLLPNLCYIPPALLKSEICAWMACPNL